MSSVKHYCYYRPSLLIEPRCSDTSIGLGKLFNITDIKKPFGIPLVLHDAECDGEKSFKNFSRDTYQYNFKHRENSKLASSTAMIKLKSSQEKTIQYGGHRQILFQLMLKKELCPIPPFLCLRPRFICADCQKTMINSSPQSVHWRHAIYRSI